MGGCYSAMRSSASSGPSSGKRGTKKNKRQLRAPSVATTITIEECHDHRGSIDHSTHLNVVILGLPSDGSDFSSRYSLGQELGRGEFGVTRLCTDNQTGEIYACKAISKRRLRTEADYAEVRREVDIMRRVARGGVEERVVRLKEAMEDYEFVYLIMELCEGGELFDRIVARGHYSERAAANVFRTIVEVVQLCHEQGVIHRDLKPENFLFANTSEDSPLKAIDFGLSVFFKPGQQFTEVVGSPYYMAPEVLKRCYGPEVDVWSAGVILYILLCGVPPFWAENDEGIAQAIIRGKYTLEREPWPRVSENAKDLVQKMLDPNPYRRLTAKEVLEHPWLKNANLAPNISLGEEVRSRLKQFSAMNKFKKKALRVVASHLPSEQVNDIKQIFHMMDKDKNGNLTFEELKEGFQDIGEAVAELDVQMLLEAADVDGNGTLDCDEFVTVSVHLKKIGSDEHLTKAFEYFDKDGSGFIEVDELREALVEGDLGPNDQIIKEIISDVDKDNDGKISYQEFELMMKSGSDWRNASRRFSKAHFSSLSHKIFRGSDASLQDVKTQSQKIN
ncbi:Calcium-dependent protein kinase [Rhynchospora pubera]|uniref:non-specific serine/threonine protein kinase n=1 Tax=Rhynchospora pubera TaxID=906938 RepID=A0AAV8EE34_9POAL|nr:Calcium-dependent protein kinase [Rhynchospora pubera]KAJ4779675.1 Calcium-dependent protein kinase [Rhynchospora pubera]